MLWIFLNSDWYKIALTNHRLYTNVYTLNNSFSFASNLKDKLVKFYAENLKGKQEKATPEFLAIAAKVLIVFLT